jgi:hypothetical protein
MTLNIAVDKQLRNPRDLVALVNAVVGAADEDEKNYVEWKGSFALDKADKAGHYAVAKCILGMANRTVAKASAFFEGCGYMVVGAQPGKVTGVTIPDAADLQDWIETYTGVDDKPRWSPHGVTVDGVTVLVVIIEPPQSGDPMYSLAKKFEGPAAGTIFIRELGRSSPAKPGDLRELQDRLRAGQSEEKRIADVKIEFTQPACVQVVDVSRENREEALQNESDRVPLPPNQRVKGSLRWASWSRH